ncbi:imidazole glycerol phosphate synthase subunit HisF [Pelagibacterales bacterium SAG-MED49]|nr:imidazole glycerol phosphate synthase subunit HisF [Pelagibacterales bacterium SAG-MED49]
MLKKRVIAVLVVSNNIVVQSKGFNKYLPVGSPEISAEAFNNWGIDELFLIDINASKEKRLINLDLVKKVASKCLVPLTVSGGIKNIQEIGQLFKVGADKVCVNNSIKNNQNILFEGKKKFGRQCMVASIDSLNIDNNFKVFDYFSGKVTKKCVFDTAIKYEEAGAGEIFINDVSRDGSYKGYDIKLANLLCKKVSIPIISCGGAGKPEHIVNILKKSNVSGAAAANYFHFYEHSIAVTKAYVNKFIQIRQDTALLYSKMPIDNNGRIGRLSDYELEEYLYEKMKVEVI